MKIVHICLAGLYMDGWGYQDNLIAKYHVRFGHDVTVIANRWIYDEAGNYVRTDKHEEIDCNGVKIIRIPTKRDKVLTGPAMRVHYVGLYQTIRGINPDIIFLHNPQILDVKDIVRYMKGYPKTKLFVDSHSDYSNSGRNFLSKHILHGILWRYKVQQLVPYTEKFYGVLPARVDFLRERYHTPKEKTELLVMGMDDEKAEEASKEEVKRGTREKLELSGEEFVIITGGKIDHAKRQTLLLIEAVKRMDNPNIRLIVFGSIVEDMKEQLITMCESDDRISYIGWLNSDETYPYFAISDLVVFPGRHSVMWEQVAGQGIPMVCKYWEGTTHVDLGGNVKFLYQDSVDEIQSMLEKLSARGSEYESMKQIATREGKNYFSYKEISRRCINLEQTE